MIGHIPFIRRGPWRPFLVKAALVAITLFLAFDAIAKRYRLGIDWQVERCLPDTRAVLIDLRSDMPKRGELIAFRGRGLEPLFADGTHMVKILVGLPGDRIEITPERTTVNGSRGRNRVWTWPSGSARRRTPSRAPSSCPRGSISAWVNPTTASTAGISG